MTIEGFAGELLDEAHADFETSRFGWNGMIDRKPAVIACCKSVDDVVAAVKYAATLGLIAVARCGGHSVSGASLPEGGVLVDLGGLKDISVDAEARIVHVGGGVLLGELDAATAAQGLAVTAGIEPSTGAGGLTLGGGIGFLCRKHGLTIDNLVGAQVVLADGSVVEANESEHADLFWALRGAGGQFGIVTRFDFAVHPVSEVAMVQAFYTLDDAKAAMQWLREFIKTAPDEIGIATSIMKVPPIEVFPAKHHGRPCFAFVASHTDAGEEGQAALKPFTEQGEPIFGVITPIPYVQFQRALADASPKGGRYYWKSLFIPELSDEVIDIKLAAARDFPGEYTQIFMEGMGGAVARVGPQETAFANRSAQFNLGISAGWSDPAIDAEMTARTRALFDALAPHSDGGVYLNYVDRDEVGRAVKAFGPNAGRLAEVKAKYDPNGVFGGALGGAG